MKLNFSENMKTINSFISLQESQENANKHYI